ncbi:MAG: PBP1A family penicillin-binding protein [Nitrospira sp.]|nr:PBP1A family penicillin-binding protein [Nitrospira sp.]
MRDERAKSMRVWVRRGTLGAFGIFGVGIAALVWYGFVLSATLALPKGDEHPPLLIYSAPFVLSPGMALAESGLFDRLQQLEYHRVSRTPRAAGEYFRGDEAIEIVLHAQPEHRLPARAVRLNVEDGLVTEVLSLPDEEPVPWVSLEPIIISGMRAGSKQVREWIPLGGIPPMLVQMLLAVEDRRFFSHYGIDPIAVGRALWVNVTRGAVVQGGSTLTQQLAKNLYYSPQRTMRRKLQEFMAAVVLECKYRKEEILESYLNEIYLGQSGSVSIYGVGEAAHRYFGKSLDELSIEEMALIVGLIKGPNSYSPVRNVKQAKERRNVVLRRLLDQGVVTEKVWAKAVKRPVKVVLDQDALTDAPHFVDYVLREVEEGTGTGIPEGARISSTLDPWIQHVAVQTLQQGLSKLESAHPSLKGAEQPLQAAMVVLEAKTGRILAMVGGRDYRVSQFNRAVQAHRSAGSLFKPFVYLAAFEAAREQGAAGLTPASLLEDEPVTLESGTGPWSPQNYDRQYRGPVTVRTALEQSLNVPAVRVAHRVGLVPFISLLRTFGITTPLPNNLSVALGSSSVSLLEITSAYAGLANGGIAMRPIAVSDMVREADEMAWSQTVDRRQAASPQGSYLVTSLLKGVVDRGTGVRARILGVQGPVAGKTGTTDGYRDAWFIGYTPELVIGVWVGFDDERPIKLTGAQAALPMWSELAVKLFRPDQADFEAPEGLVERRIDPQTGQLATSQCPEKVSEVFIAGTEPTVYCEVHGGGLWERLKQTFGFF